MSELTRLVSDLTAAGPKAERRARGALGEGADMIRDTAQSMAAGRGWSQESQDNIYARTGSPDRQPEAYVFGTSAVFYQELGTSRHGPNPVLGPAMDMHDDAIADLVAERVADVL